MAIGTPINPIHVFQPSPQRLQFGGSSGPSSPRAGQKQQAQDVFKRSASTSEPDAVQKQLAEADLMLP